MPKRKKSKYKHILINKKNKKFIWTFSSYDTKDEVFSDRNVMPMGCVLKLEKRDV